MHTNPISYAYIPVTMNTITEADVRAFHAAVRKSDGPVLAHCKTGMRSLSLYLIGEVLTDACLLKTSYHSDISSALIPVSQYRGLNALLTINRG